MAQVTVEGTEMRLGDVAEVVEDHQPLIGDAVVNDAPGLLLIVEKFPGTNTLEVTRDVENALAALPPGLSGLEMDSSIYRRATFIEMAIDNLTTVLLVGSLLVVLVLGAFFHNWRVALISLVAIPTSLLAAVFVLYLNGTTFNTMVLAGLAVALGAIVDDAIIDVENIVQRLRQRRKEGFVKSTATVILQASLEMRSVVVYATLIVVLVVVPVFVMGGLFGSFFQPLAMSYVLAVLTSMLVAMTVTPALSRILLSRTPLKRGDSPIVGWMRRGYDAVFSRTIQKPLPVYLAVSLLMLAGLAILPWLRRDAQIPTFKENDLLIDWEGAPGVLRERVGEALGTNGAVVVRIYGEDLEVLGAKATELRQVLSKIDGIVDAKVEHNVTEPQVEIEVDLEAVKRYGLKPGDVRRSAACLLSGEEVGDVHIANRTYDVQVWSTPETRHSLTSIRNLPMDIPAGGHVSLGEVADVRVAPTPNVIKREHLKRRIDVGANVRGRDLGSVVAEVERALQKVDFPLEYHPELLGEYAERQAVQNRMLAFAVAAAIGIFFLLQTAFGSWSRSWRLASIAFLTLPSALVGGVLAAYLSGPQSISIAPSALKAKAGLITTLPARNTQLEEGAVMLTASGRPVFVLLGSIPAYRDLVPGISGDDARQLEEGLKRPGFDPGPMDGAYDERTGTAVAEWYRSAGWEPFGPTAGQLATVRTLEQDLAVAIDEQALGIQANGVVERVANTPGTHGVDGYHVYLEVRVGKTPTPFEGFSLRLTIPIKSTESVVTAVPLSALSLAADGTSRVQVRKQGQLEYVVVEPGLSAGGFVEVAPVEGTLEPGQLVVVGFENAGSADTQL